MKKLSLSIVILICSGIALFGKDVLLSDAKKVAVNHYRHFSHYRTPGNVSEVIVLPDENRPLCYVFNFSTGGYAVVSADDDVMPVLSYSFKGKFKANDPEMPPAYRNFLQNFETQIDIVKNNHIKGDQAVRQKWDYYLNDLIPQFKSINDVSPLLDIDNIKWAQGCYYNASCPADASGECGHVQTGCVATAMGQIMRYHSWPDHGTGSHSYTHQTYGTLSADFSAASYNWAGMPGQLSSADAEVAEILYHCGVAVDMSYGPYGSGSLVYGYVREGFVNYFNYDPEAFYAYRDNYSDANWKNLLYADLDNGFPVFYSGTDQSGSGGHAFVCDGYQANDYFHFNWGWSGAYNSYNLIDDMTAGGNNFSYNHQVVFNVHPIYGLTAVFAADPRSIYEGNSVSFSDGSYGNPNSWTWNFGDGVNSTQQNPVHQYNTPGLYDVTLTIGDGSSTNAQTKADYIKVVPTDAGFSMDFEDCVNYSNDFFPWSLVDGDHLNTYGSVDCDFPGETNLMSFIAFNPSDAGFSLATAHGGQRVGMSICPGDASQSDDWIISENLHLGTGSSISLWALSPKPGTWGNNTYQVLVSTTGINTTDFTVISGANPVEAPASWTQHTYGLSSYDNQDIYVAIKHVSADKFMLWIDDIVINTTGGTVSLNADFFADVMNIPVNGTVNFSDNSVGSPITWSWDFGDAGTSVLQNPSHIYTSAGVYTVSLIVSDGTSSDTETKQNYIVVSDGPNGSWIPQATGFATASRGIGHISVVDENIVWATAYDGTGGGAVVQEFTRTTDGGTTWTPGTINVGNTGLGIAMINALDASTAWVVAYPNASGQYGGIWKTANSGSV
ncbi:MAG: C10 family peptidase, partial [Bacteroidetes bacterium]|nr:C10 family peptidase [Bacteroidota bacterium]